MITPHTTVDTGIGIFTPVPVSIRLENADPHTPFCTANQPIMEIMNSAEISFDEPCFPKTPDATTHVGTPRSLPIIPQNIISATITAYPITPDQMACDIGMDSARIPPSIRLGTQIMIPAWIMATSAQLFLSSIGTCSSVTDSTFPAFFSCSKTLNCCHTSDHSNDHKCRNGNLVQFVQGIDSIYCCDQHDHAPHNC